jgi:hypothetical protein
MPSQISHENQWDSNHRLLTQLIRQKTYLDWIATVAFYTALHSVERYFARRNEHPGDHRTRNQTLIRYKVQLGQQILNDYEDMYNTSKLARYTCAPLTDADIQGQLDRLSRIDTKIGPMLV